MDYKAKAVDCGGCAVFDAAVARWRKAHCVDDYEQFIKACYAREARLSGGMVISLATGDPLTGDELARADLYEIAVMYDDGAVSKQWKDPKAKPASAYSRCDNAERIARRKAMYPALANNPTRYRGELCRKCGGEERYFRSGACVRCENSTQTAWAKR